MTAPGLFPFRWTGESFEPANRYWAKRCDEVFVGGAVYTLTQHEERSAVSHRHYFAQLNEVWQNLPEDQAEHWPTVEHFRKHLLIRAGFRDERSIVCSSRAEALRLAGFIKPMDEYAIVVTAGAVVTVWTAQSQSMKAMDRKRFAESKQAVLDLAAEMIGVAPDALAANAAQAA